MDSNASETSSEASIHRKDSLTNLPSPYVCPHCTQIFDIHERIPKFLPCSHVCCLTCLLKMPALKRECPVCQSPMRLFGETEMRKLPINQPVYLALLSLAHPIPPSSALHPTSSSASTSPSPISALASTSTSISAQALASTSTSAQASTSALSSSSTSTSTSNQTSSLATIMGLQQSYLSHSQSQDAPILPSPSPVGSLSTSSTSSTSILLAQTPPQPSPLSSSLVQATSAVAGVYLHTSVGQVPEKRDVIRCRAHGKRLKYYCPAPTCRIAVCTFCALEQHQHGSIPIIDAALQQRGALHTRIQQTRNAMYPLSSILLHTRDQSQVCEKKETRMLEAVDRCIGMLMQTLEDRRRALREQISREMRTNMRSWQSEETVLSEKMSFFQGSLQALEGIMEHTSDPQFLMMSPQLSILMDGIEQENSKILEAGKVPKIEPEEERTVKLFQSRLHKAAEGVDQAISSLLFVLHPKEPRQNPILEREHRNRMESTQDQTAATRASISTPTSALITSTATPQSPKRLSGPTPLPSPALLSLDAEQESAPSWTFDSSECAKTIVLSPGQHSAHVDGHEDGFVLGTEGFWSGIHTFSVHIINRGFGGIAVGVIQKPCKGKNGYSLFASYSWHSLGSLYSNSNSWSGCPSARFDTGDILTVTVDVDAFQLTIVNQRNGQIVKQPLPPNISELGPYYPFFYLNPGGSISLHSAAASSLPTEL
eukprot:TRINITY_DN993_c0_g2_i3.p1 TRINITY_DN993_c0_g2~~TRINITY_DN993_c0_g2_i3.p1  ORF type:complete len:712 (-),score=149.54 TRINITY_DN993_c0_g2_i3:570-2705(-)